MAASVVSALAACGGQGSNPSPETPALAVASRCADWQAASPAARRRLASALEREGRTTAERSRRVERACRRYGDDVPIEEALARLAVDQHRPAG